MHDTRFHPHIIIADPCIKDMFLGTPTHQWFWTLGHKNWLCCWCSQKNLNRPCVLWLSINRKHGLVLAISLELLPGLHKIAYIIVLKLEFTSKFSGELINMPIAGPTISISNSVGLRRGLSIYISNNFSGDTSAAGLEITLWEPVS